MNLSKMLLFLSLLGGSGIVAYVASSRKVPAQKRESTTTAQPARSVSRPAPTSSRRSDISAPLPLDKRQIERMDPTNYEVTVSNIALDDIGRKIERESRERLRKLTERYQLTANQRREAFPLLVSYHADYTEGLIVNGFAALPPRASQLTSELYLIMDIFQQETFQEDVLADKKWWNEILDQLRIDLDDSLYSTGRKPSEGRDGASEERPDLDLDELFGN